MNQHRISEIIEDLGRDQKKLDQWYEFFYANEPVVAAVADYADAHKFRDADKFKLITSVFLKQKYDEYEMNRKNG